MMHPEKQALVNAGAYEDLVVRRVRDLSDGEFDVLTKGSTPDSVMGSGFVQNFRGSTPKPGDRIRLFTARGSLIRGIDLNDEEIYFKTEAELDTEHAKFVAEQKAKQLQEFEEKREEYDRQFDDLPESFQTRIQIFRDNCPTFRWQFEGYELFTCTEAVKIADHLGAKLGPEPTDEAIREAAIAFRGSFEDQESVISDGHSGNTFGTALMLARMHLMDENGIKADGTADLPLVVQQHGALTPLVGCQAYGCVHPRPEA